jgi:dTDP-glucose 4,6-dehydratase
MLWPSTSPRRVCAVGWRSPIVLAVSRARAVQCAAKAVADGLLWALAVGWAAACRFDFDLERVSWGPVVHFAVLAGLAQVLAGYLVSLYRDRFAPGSFDEVLVLSASVLAVSLLGSAAVIAFPVTGVPRSLPFLAFPLALVLTCGARYLTRAVSEHGRRPAPTAERVLIYGAGSVGAQLARRMLHDPTSPFLPVGFLDDDLGKRNLRSSGVRVLGTGDALPAVAQATAASGVVVAIDRADAVLIRRICDAATAAGLRCMVMPPLNQLMGGELTLAAVREVDIPDMIGRHPVDTDVTAIAHYLTGKRVLVTGAGGSIGSELCRQIHKFAPEALIMLDRDESALHSVELSIYGLGLLDSPQIVLADIRDKPSLQAIFADLGPDVVFHAAALKHLPLLERYPLEAWKTNVIGTLNVLEASADVGVSCFINISTDKAANPVSALGCSKRLAEQLTSWMSGRAEGSYLSVRFGNVLGSRGSVVHAFRAQIAANGPVTVTHPQVTRFFMTVSEACQLVVQAGAIGRSGEALVLDMGEPVRILDVAQRMIAASGKPVEIVFTGLRPGERLHEELLGDGRRASGRCIRSSRTWSSRRCGPRTFGTSAGRAACSGRPQIPATTPRHLSSATVRHDPTDLPVGTGCRPARGAVCPQRAPLRVGRAGRT